MKKTILFLGLLGSLTSCDKLLDDTPKCDDKEVLELVEELGTPKEDYWVNIYNDYYDETLYKDGTGGTKLDKQLSKKRWEYLGKKYDDIIWPSDIKDKETRDKYLEESGKLYSEDNEKVQKEINENMDYIKNNYQTDAKLKAIYDSYYLAKTSNIRPVSSDKENKKCECEATLTLGSSIEDNVKEIFYTAQKNTDGNIYVELLNW